jgi:hypothetical protein
MEEVKQEVQVEAPVAEAVQETVVTKEEVEQIKDEITKVEEDKLSEAKAEGIVEGKTIAQLQAELEATKAENTRIAAEQAELKQRQELEAEIAREKAKLEQPVKKHVVAPSENPISQPQVAQATERKLSKEEEWAMFDEAFRTPRSATIPLEK